MTRGPWIERLEAIAVARELVAVAGRRDAAFVTTSRVHVAPLSLLDGKGTAWSLDAKATVRALAFAGDELLLSGGDDGRLLAWDVTGQKVIGELALGRAAIHAIAIDSNVARGSAGTICVGTADGAVHVVRFAISNATPSLTGAVRHALSDGPITALAYDPAGLWVAGGADGQLRVIGEARGDGGRVEAGVGGGAADIARAPHRSIDVRALSPGGDGGIRAVVCMGDGRAAIGCGDGSIRTLFVVGDVEAYDRSGDHGHQGAVRGLALGPVIVDDAGREQPRRLFSAGEDGAIKSWFIDGARRPKTIEIGIGALTGLAFFAGPVPKPGMERPGFTPGRGEDKAQGRLWTCSTNRKVATLVVGSDADVADNAQKLGSILDSYEELVKDAKAAAKVQLEVVARLAELAEDEARQLLDLALSRGHAEVRIAATQAMVRSNRRASRPALRAALAAEVRELRGAAFHALRDLEQDQPLSAIRAGLAVRHEDVRLRAVEALIPLARTSVIAAGLIADALRDAHPDVRHRAFTALVQVAPSSLEAVRITLARGAPDVRATALLHLALVLRAHDPAARAQTAAAFDDADATVRSSAFLAAVMQRPKLAARLLPRVPSLQQSLEQMAKALNVAFAVPPDDGAALDDDTLEPLFAQLACRSADAAIRGAGCLLALGDPRAVGAVLQLTREADPALRRGATSNLVLALAAWPEDDRLGARLAWLLDDVDHDVRHFAFDALAKTAATSGAAGELDLSELALRTSQEDIRVRALQILVRVGAPPAAGQPDRVAERASKLLGDALDDEATKVRGEAFRTLWAWHTADPLTPLTRGAASRHADLRTQVVQEIARRRDAKQSTAEMDKILRGLVGDAVAGVGLAAYGALTKQPEEGEVAIPPEVHLAAMASPVGQVRAAGAAGSHKAGTSVRARLVELVKDDNPIVHTAAIEALDAVAPSDAEGFALALGSIFYNLQARAGELLGARRDGRGIEAMKRLLAIPKTDINRPSDGIRQRAARALADVGDIATIAFQRNLIDQDEDPIVREMAARGLATAAQPGHEPSLQALVALLGHADLAVRSWGGEGLAKLGDLRALPVLAGTQRHEHRPLRIGAIVGFVALGPDGVRGLRQGLEDKDREIQDLAFAVIVARDKALADAGIAPDLLVDAVASPSPEIRFAAARLVERRAAGEPLDADAIGELVGPRKLEKAQDMKDWPPPARQAAMLQVLADAIASDEPARRYASAQVLALRTQPIAFWREAARLAGPSKGAPSPHTSWSTEKRVARRSGWLRRLVGDRRDPEATELEQLAKLFVRVGHRQDTGRDTAGADRLVFGVYAGLVRQAPPRGEADETHRVRRDAIGRLVELAHREAVGVEAVLPVLSHAVGDPHHLVRQAAMAALRSLYPVGALAPLQMAIGGAADLGKAALEELVALSIDGDDRAAALVRSALDADDPEVRAHAALRIEKLYPAGSAEPKLLAAQSRHADVRLAAITQLASATDPSPAIVDALVAALASEHADLRLRAAVALARRGNSQSSASAGHAARAGIDVLGAFLRSEETTHEALKALIGLADRPDSAGAAADVIAARLDDDPDRTANRHHLVDALSKIGHPNGAAAAVRLVVNVEVGKEGDALHYAAFAVDALARMLEDRTKKPQRLPDGRTRTRYREDLALQHLGEAAKSPLVPVRLPIAKLLGDVDDRAVEDILAKLVADRDPEVRVAAAESLALRAEYVPAATLVVLEAALRGGRRELVLPAALGLAARRRPEAFQPLLLVAKAGEPPEQERALLALGSLGDRRALDHLLPLLDPAPEDELSRALTPTAVEALGRLVPSLQGDEATEIRGRVERIALAAAGPARLRAITGLRYAGELPTLERIASDREARNDVRAHAIRELGLAASATSEQVLAELLSDELYEVRDAAITALTTILHGDRTRVSLHALSSPHDHISRPAATYLATAGDPATLVARIGQVKNPDLRRTLREGLIRRSALPEPELAAALTGDNAAARAEVAWIIGYAGPAAARLADPVIQAVARSAAEIAEARKAPRAPADAATSVEAYWASLWAARRVGASGAVAVESAATTTLASVDDRATASRSAELRRQAAAVLASAGSGNANAALANVLGDADREVRAIASTTLAARDPRVAPTSIRALGSRADATTIAPLAWTAWPELAQPFLADAATRYWAVPVSLWGTRAAELIEIATTRSNAQAERIAAIAALGRIGGTEALAALETIHNTDSEDDAIKLAAWKALRRIGRKGGKTYAEGEDKGGGGQRSSRSSASGGGDDDEDGGGDDDGGDDDDDEDGGRDDDDGDGDDDDGDGDDDDDDGGDDDDYEEDDDDE